MLPAQAFRALHTMRRFENCFCKDVFLVSIHTPFQGILFKKAGCCSGSFQLAQIAVLLYKAWQTMPLVEA